MSLVWYDTETTGTSTAFDQILQFAAIRTDDELEEVERFEIRSRLLPYVVPSPHALRVTGQTIDDLLDEARPSHYEMVTQIRRALGAWCPAAFVGYNSLRFDEELLRQAFYQCLHPPYLTNTGGSKRADALHLIRAAAILSPGLLTIPPNDKGGLSFKLDRLAPANGFEHVNAHDALADVEALIHLCRVVRNGNRPLWDRFLRFGAKAAVEAFLRANEAFLVLEFFPVQTGAYVVTPIGSNNGNVVYGYDLTVDPAELHGLDDDELVARLAQRPRPLRNIKKNAAPSLCPLEEAPSFALSGISPQKFVRRARIVRSDRRLVDRLVAAATGMEAVYPPSPHVERQIYDGFWSHADGRRLEQFHAGTWERRAALISELEDPRLVWLARRLVFVERPDLLPEQDRRSMAVEKAGRLLAANGDTGGWTTLSKATSDAEALALEPASDAESHQRLLAYLETKQAEAVDLLTAASRAVAMPR